ncbi:unnamed protein product [Soboliphyme baturini]|uniref:Reverse transcriptase domain-containing protein n=1 Tax=Soboliphyme baturini TaxID=241478 RepID=A0A183IWC7_9BILA|nr:unnamed protein product [Soboliphyme baturini]
MDQIMSCRNGESRTFYLVTEWQRGGTGMSPFIPVVVLTNMQPTIAQHNGQQPMDMRGQRMAKDVAEITEDADRWAKADVMLAVRIKLLNLVTEVKCDVVDRPQATIDGASRDAATLLMIPFSSGAAVHWPGKNATGRSPRLPAQT